MIVCDWSVSASQTQNQPITQDQAAMLATMLSTKEKCLLVQSICFSTFNSILKEKQLCLNAINLKIVGAERDLKYCWCVHPNGLQSIYSSLKNSSHSAHDHIPFSVNVLWSLWTVQQRTVKFRGLTTTGIFHIFIV